MAAIGLDPHPDETRTPAPEHGRQSGTPSPVAPDQLFDAAGLLSFFCRLAIEERSVMSEIPLRHGLWLAVCDGQKALLLENEGDRTYPKLETRHKSEQKNPLSHEQGSSPSGRAFSSSGRRAAVEENDLHLQQADAFIKQFATLINLDVAAGRIGELALIAPARALGQLRSHLSESAGKILVGELARDYVKLPLYEIERMLSKP